MVQFLIPYVKPAISGISGNLPSPVTQSTSENIELQDTEVHDDGCENELLVQREREDEPQSIEMNVEASRSNKREPKRRPNISQSSKQNKKCQKWMPVLLHS